MSIMFKSRDGLPSFAQYEEHITRKADRLNTVDWSDAIIWSIDNRVNMKSCFSDQQKLDLINLERRMYGLPPFYISGRRDLKQ